MSVTEAPDELPAPEEGEESDAKAKGRGGSLIALIGALVLMSLVAAGTGGGLGIKLADRIEDAVRAKQEAAREASGLPRYMGATHLSPLPPVVTNLGNPSDVWIRIEASIVFDDEALQTDEVLAAKITEDILAYLRTVSLSQIEGPSGMQHLREDLADRARVRSDGRVAELVIQTLVVQ